MARRRARHLSARRFGPRRGPAYRRMDRPPRQRRAYRRRAARACLLLRRRLSRRGRYFLHHARSRFGWQFRGCGRFAIRSLESLRSLLRMLLASLDFDDIVVRPRHVVRNIQPIKPAQPDGYVFID
jgi:hypothetical protein